MLDSILSWDYVVFDAINQELSHPILDYLLPIMREKTTWIPIYIGIILGMFYQLKKRGWMLLTFTLLTVGTADFVSSSIIKKSIQRERPCQMKELEVQERVDCGSGFSFTSSHAANHFALSFFLIWSWVRKRGVKSLLILWAVIISFSQVYVGVHFPSDVVGGAVLGIVIAYVFHMMYLKVHHRTKLKSGSNS